MAQPDVTAPSGSVIVATHAGVSLVLDCRDSLLPRIVHWGAALPDLDHRTATALADARVPVAALSSTDHPVPVAVLPELSAGWTGRPGLSVSRAGRAWSSALRTRSITVEALDDGVRTGPGTHDDPLGGGGSAIVHHGPCRVRVEARDDETEIQVGLEIELLASGLIRSRASVTNLGEELAIDAVTIAYPVPAEATELLDLAGRWGRERIPQRQPFAVGTHLRENRKGRTGPDSAYVMHAGTQGFGFGSGEIHGIHVAWSGNHVHYAEQIFTGHKVLGGGELLLPGEMRLRTGETYDGPWVYGSYGIGLDEVARRFHTHLRTRERPVEPDRPVTLNVWEAVYFDHDLDRLLALAERAAEVGVERYVLDDGWFGSRRDDTSGLGDWVVSPQVWPDGLHPLIERVSGLGMQFGLWFEPEMVNPDSDLARAHPDWVMAARSHWPVEARHQQVLNLSIPQAYDHVLGRILAILDEYDIGYLKWDHNRDLIEAGNALEGGRPAVHAQTAAFYRMLDDIRTAHPGIEIESCSSGGARIDLAVLERTDRIWVSDNTDPHDRQEMQRWTAQLIPPEYLGSHIAAGRSHTTGRRHDLGFRASTALFGHLGIEWDITTASQDELAELAAWIAFYRANRRLLLTGHLVRMDGVADRTLVHGVVAPDRSRALFAHVVLDSPGAAASAPIRLRELEPTRRYRVRPVVIGTPPSGLDLPRWCGDRLPDGSYPGTVLDGATLHSVGVAGAHLNPDQVLLFSVDAE